MLHSYFLTGLVKIRTPNKQAKTKYVAVDIHKNSESVFFIAALISVSAAIIK
jgi:hypothetical protein